MHGSVVARMEADSSTHDAMESGVVTPSLQGLHVYESFRGRSLLSHGVIASEGIPHRIDRPGP